MAKVNLGGDIQFGDIIVSPSQFEAKTDVAHLVSLAFWQRMRKLGKLDQEFNKL